MGQTANCSPPGIDTQTCHPTTIHKIHVDVQFYVPSNRLVSVGASGWDKAPVILRWKTRRDGAPREKGRGRRSLATLRFRFGFSVTWSSPLPRETSSIMVVCFYQSSPLRESLPPLNPAHPARWGADRRCGAARGTSLPGHTTAYPAAPGFAGVVGLLLGMCLPNPPNAPLSPPPAVPSPSFPRSQSA